MKTIYDDMWSDAVEDFQTGRFAYDRMLNDKHDSRRGLSLIFRPDSQTISKFNQFLQEATEVDGKQYHQSQNNIHTTVLSVVSCREGFNFDRASLPEYIELIESCLNEISAFTVSYFGITASSSCVLAQGFPETKDLANARHLIREKFKHSKLENTIDSRYTIRTAHATLIRFSQKLTDERRYLDLLKASRQRPFGLTPVAKFDLVSNDWYHRDGLVEKLHSFPLIA